jgi:uncharacterized protein
MRVVLMPRWSGTASSDWYPWLAQKLDIPVAVAELDRPDAPTIDGCVASLRAAIGPDPSKVVLVGHSVSCLAITHLLAASPPRSVPAAVLVAAWWTVDEPWATIRPWIDTPVATERARLAIDRTYVLLSDNDPFTTNAAETASLWSERLGANVRHSPGGAHFNAAEEPAVLDLIAEAIATARGRAPTE